VYTYNIININDMSEPPNILLRVIVTVLLWVGIWGIIELLIDYVVGDNKIYRFASYTLLILLGVFLLWFFQISM
jgi:hypothetical protein